MCGRSILMHSGHKGDSGAALLIALLVLSLFSILGLYMTLNATVSVHISDNFESQIQATYAALAGLNHARALLRGLALDDVLKGSDGAYDKSLSYMTQAKSFVFRLPFSLMTAQTLNIFDPMADISAIPDDGIISTGCYNGVGGTVLIPMTGISQNAPNPYGPGTILTSRYFVKVTDNNGDPSEIAGDPSDNPFFDGDGIVIVRSMGVAKTLSEKTGNIIRRNSVVVFETRLKRFPTWDLGPALVVQGADVSVLLSGAYEISGGASPGIGVINAAPFNGQSPTQMLRTAAGSGNITGGGQPNPSVSDITDRIRANPDQSLLLNPDYLWDFVFNQAPKIADNFLEGAQNWSEGNAPNLGSYDNSKAWNAPGQDPKITLVNGNLQISGSVSGGGMLIVTGDFSCSGLYSFNGLVLVVGTGKLAADGAGCGIEGELIIANLANTGGMIAFGTPSISISGNSRFSSNRKAVQMAIGLIPASQISFREIAGSDP
jgi:hypothetical protein